MKTINMGGSGLYGSAIVVGCMRIAGMPVPQAAALVDRALSVGINLFDHADIYGGGDSERLFGKLFAEQPSLREKLILQSKCGIRDGWYDLSRKYILNSVDGILERLGTDYLDVLMLHRPDALMNPDEIAEAFNALLTSGKVRYFGVSNMNPAQIELIASAVKQSLIVNQLQFSAAHTGIVDSGINVNVPGTSGSSRDGSVLEYCRLKGITVQTWSSLQYGFFEGTFLENGKYPELNKVLSQVSEKYGCTPATAAIAWILRHPADMQAIVGTTNPKRIEELAKAAEIVMNRQEWYDIYRAAGNRLP